MKYKIFILEGADGSGKSSLAKKIARAVNGNVLHQTYNKKWDMEEYAEDVIEAAAQLAYYQPVVLDRWAPSEYVYSKVFRNGETYDTKKLIDLWNKEMDICWIYCRSDKSIENHARKAKLGLEMFDDNKKVIEEYEVYIKYSDLDWYIYDYEKNNTEQFIKEITK